MPHSLGKLQQGHWERAFKANVSEIASAANWVESIAASAGLSDAQAFSMQVCLEELMSNIVQHGEGHCSSNSQWPSGPGNDHLTITIAINAYADRITMSVEDNARPFDVSKAVGKKIDQPLDQTRAWRIRDSSHKELLERPPISTYGTWQPGDCRVQGLRGSTPVLLSASAKPSMQPAPPE
jgi:anti-sigma regulatory factor (Ser/Thr protein kinase)